MVLHAMEKKKSEWVDQKVLKEEPAILNAVIMEALNPRVTFKENEEVKELDMWDKSVPGQGTSKCKDPEAGVYLVLNEQQNLLPR